MQKFKKIFFYILIYKRIIIPAILIIVLAITFCFVYTPKNELDRDVYFDKVHGVWLGKMIGVYYGQYTEFGISWSKYNEPLKITWRDKDYTEKIPPGWLIVPEYANDQDDIGINLLNLRILETYGLKPKGKEIAKVWVKNNPAVACANYVALKNMERNIYPPLSGNPAFNKRYRDIDAQIDNDIFGMISPGLPNTSEKMTFKFAKTTNSEEGVYSAVFITQCISNAFFEKDIKKIIKKSLKKVPPKSMTAEIVRNVLNWHKQYPDWRQTRQMIVQKYPLPDIFSIPNLGFVVTGLLYGEGDFEKTLQTTAFCGFDSDCNPATACGILGAMLGASKIPEIFKEPVGDTFHNLTVKDYPEKMSIKDIVRRTVNIGEKVILTQAEGQIIKEKNIKYIYTREKIKPPKIDEIPITLDEIRDIRLKVRDNAVEALSKRNDLELMKESIYRLMVLAEIQPDIIDALTRSALFTTAQKLPILALISAQALAIIKDGRAINIFLTALRDKNLPFYLWKDIHGYLSPFYYDPYVSNFFVRELLVYKDQDVSKTLELIPIFKGTSEAISKYAINIIKTLKDKDTPEFQKRIFELHYHPSLMIRDDANELYPKTSFEWDGWEVRCVGNAPLVGVLDEFNKKKNVLCTHPLEGGYPAYLCKWVELEKDKKYELSFNVCPFNQEIKVDKIGGYSLYQTADWIMMVIVNGDFLANEVISWKNKECRWIPFKFDLSKYAGKKVGIILQNNPKDWYWEQGFWADVKIEEK